LGALAGFVPANGVEGSWPWVAHEQCVHKRGNRPFLSKIRLLGGLDGNGADVCNVVAFFEGWYRVDVQDDTGDGSASFEYDFAEIVGDKADFHALLNIGTTLHKRVPNARAIGQDIHDSVKPDGILDGPSVSGKHLESTHSAECPVDEKGHVIRFDGAGIASFNDDGRFAASSRGVVEVASGG
jgi:hypothetical protein